MEPRKTVADPGAGVGRPRDPSLDARVHAAARDVYGRLGWAGFSIETVARTARVGKSSIYLRWPDTTALLLDMLESTVDLPLDPDTGSVRGDLLVLARSVLDLLTGEDGDTILRLSTEARMVPELAPRWEQFVQTNVTAVRKIIRRAAARGELSEGTRGDLMLNALVGGLMMQCLTTPPSRRTRIAREAQLYTESLVDLVLASTINR
jgi:AcrR family transcriptional regulator